MKILIIAPLTPPYTGNALPVKLIFDHLDKRHDIKLVNLNKKSYKAGINSLKRVFEIINVFFQIILSFKNKDLIYLTIAESFSGNLRDLIIYSIMFSKRKKTIIHMLGGASMKNILDENNGIIFKINRFFIKRLGNVIVEGQMQADFFSKVIPMEQIYIIPNFAQEFLFTNTKAIEEKFLKVEPLNLLFLSNMIYGKGHNELLNAFIQLDSIEKEQLRIDFAGNFDTEKEKNDFLKKISSYSQIKYNGHVSGKEKHRLFSNAHVFCLPTYYPYEGQPFVIVEAYASGCAVITTNHSGISNIFTDKINGYEVEKASVESLKMALKSIISQKSNLSSFAIINYNHALEKYTEQNYLIKIEKLVNQYSIN